MGGGLGSAHYLATRCNVWDKHGRAADKRQAFFNAGGTWADVKTCSAFLRVCTSVFLVPSVLL